MDQLLHGTGPCVVSHSKYQQKRGTALVDRAAAKRELRPKREEKRKPLQKASGTADASPPRPRSGVP